MTQTRIHRLTTKLLTLIRREDIFFLTCAVLCTLLVTSLVTPALFARPIADDFHYFNDLSSHNLTGYLAYFYSHSTGRLAQGFSVAILYKLFGATAVIIGPLIEIITLVVVCSWVAYLLFSAYKVTSKRTVKSLTVGTLCAFLILIYPVSLFDSLYWLTSSTVYVASLIALFFNIGLTWCLMSSNRLRPWHVTILVLSIIAGQTFSEATSAIVIVLTGLALSVSILLVLKKRALVPNTFSVLVPVFIASIIGFALVYLSPGSRQRQASSGSQFDLHAMIFGSLHHTIMFLHTLVSWQLILAIGIGMLLAAFLRRFSRRQLFALTGIGIGLIIIPAYITFVIATYSMATYTPLRLYSIPAAFASIGFVLTAAATWQYISQLRPGIFPRLAPVLSIILILVSYVGLFPVVRDITSAQALRASLYDMRQASIKQQLAAHTDPVHITPAPIILNNSEAGDFSFKNTQVPWFTDSFKQYNHITNQNIQLSNTQPTGYCLQDQAPTWYGVSTCANEAH